MFFFRSRCRSATLLSFFRPITSTTSASSTPCSRLRRSFVIMSLTNLLIVRSMPDAEHPTLHCQSNARAHRGANVRALYERALERRGLQARYLVQKRLNIVGQLRRVEAHFANDRLHDTGLVGAELQ